MDYSKDFTLFIHPAPEPLQMLRDIVAEIGGDVEIERIGDGIDRRHEAWLRGEDLSVSAFINQSKGIHSLGALFQAVFGRNTDRWLDFSLHVFTRERFDELAPTIVRVIGAALRNSDGNAIFFSEFLSYAGLVRREGQVYLSTPSWWWSPEDEELLNIPHEFQDLPGTYARGPGYSRKVFTPGNVFLPRLSGHLQAVLGTPLVHAGYWHENDIPDLGVFRAESPNEGGLRTAALEFGGGMLLISPSEYTPWRRNGTCNILAALDPEGTGAQLLEANEDLTLAGADGASPWSDVIGTQLLAVEVYGIGTVPHIIRFVFPTVSPVVCLGYPARPLIGDAGLLLVFSDDEWLLCKTTLRNTWEKIWECRLPAGE